MSLGMTVGARDAALNSPRQQIEAEAAPAARLWLQKLLVAAGSTFGVLLASALGVLLFLR